MLVNIVGHIELNQCILFLRSYITNDFVGIFRNHFNKTKTILNFLLPFVHGVSTKLIKNLWKIRNEKWKTRRSDLGLSKKSFANYPKNFTDQRRNQEVILNNNTRTNTNNPS
ncbi:hypothetical protein GLOIN_2v1790609 [Rhizophagus irregularis DAOM 181602=DAOM 197198]|nr:hypothetical protein GLOIN_2v1790609 [Rhizophagus irregularis DAOM 181602=DAOM 197198]